MLAKQQSSTIPKIEEKKVELVFSENDDFDPNSGWISLFYGASGAGKTWLLGTAQDALIVNAGGGLDTLNSPLFKARYPNIRRKVVNVYEKFENSTIKKATAFDMVCDILDHFLNNMELRSQIKTVGIDDASALRFVALLRGIEIQDQPRDNKRRLNRYVLADMADIGREMKMMDWFFAQYIPIFKNEGINFVLLAHERQIYGKADKMGNDRPLKGIKPGFSGQTFPDEVPRHFDEVLYIEKKYGKEGAISQIQTDGGGNVLVKTRRAGVFAKYEVGKSYEQLLQQRKDNQLHPSYLKR